jgi:flavin-dependent dehydrogenase
MPDFEATVVGALAGAPTAMLLARKSYRVVLLDRATFSSDTMCNHVILYRAVRLLLVRPHRDHQRFQCHLRLQVHLGIGPGW